MFEDNRMKNLIEERIEYENGFISVEDIIKSDEMDYQIAQMQFFIDNIEKNPHDFYDCAKEFASEEYLNQLHDEKLISERLEYESRFYAEMEEAADVMDIHLEALENPQYFDDPLEDDWYFEEYNMDAYYCGNNMAGYIVSDDPFDSLGGCDYPEGPSENIGGLRYPEPVFECYSEPDYDFDDSRFGELELIRLEEEYLKDFNEDVMKNLIEEHIEEEKKFFEYIKENEIRDDCHVQFVDEEIILC